MALNPQFVNVSGADGILGYQSPAADGRDDDFHEQSLQGSYHGGALAPVVSAATGLPILLSPALTVDANESPAIDRGAATDNFGNEPTPNGGYINIGTYGNTAQASLSPVQYLLVTQPGAGGEVWPEGQTFNITWRFALAPVNGSTPPAGTVDITLLQVGNATPVLTIAAGVPNNGLYSWTLPSSITPGNNYLIQVSSDQYAGLSASSAQPFTIPAPVHTYYINDAAANSGDWTTAAGSDGNDGLTPATPKASIAGVLAAYHLNPGDTIMVDAGVYNLNNVLVLNAAASGIIIEGYNGPNYPASAAVFNRGLSSSDVIDVNGATNLTLEYLTVTGGAQGIAALDNSGSTGLTISNCIAFGNNTTGIYIGPGDNNAVISNNIVYGLPHNGNNSDNQANGIFIGNYGTLSGVSVTGNIVHDSPTAGINVVIGNAVGSTGDTVSNNEVYACGTGISVTNGSSGLADVTTVSGNTVFNNGTGIWNAGDVLTTKNIVYGQSGAGIYIPYGVYDVLANTVHDNATGIYSFSNSSALIQGNTVYHNSGDGIDAQGLTNVIGNTVYGNATGIAFDYTFSSAVQQASNNLVYANTNQGILVTGYESVSLINNTVYQPTGDAIDVFNHSHDNVLRNNILWTQAGYDINVDSTSEVGFQSDYNDLYTTNSGFIGLWEGQSFSTLANWILELDLDHNSLSVDPQFVSPAGADGILGYSNAPIGAAQVIDDASPAGFSTTGSWTSYTNAAADNGEELTAAAGSGEAVASWTFTGLVPGATYRVSASSAQVYYLASDAPFSILDGSQLISLTYQQQQSAPSIPGTPAWQSLGYFVTTTGTLTVKLSNAAQATVAADAVMIQQIQGDGSADDNFRVAAGSPAVDAGNPNDPIGTEPIPNGGRVDQGAYGGAPQATASPVPEVQVLTPAGLDKLQAGEPFNVAWRTSGIQAPAGYYSNAILADGPLAYYRLGDASGLAAADASGNGLAATYVGGVQIGQTGAAAVRPGHRHRSRRQYRLCAVAHAQQRLHNRFQRRSMGQADVGGQLPAFLRFWQRRLRRQHHAVPRRHIERLGVHRLSGRFARQHRRGIQRDYPESMAALRREHGCQGKCYAVQKRRCYRDGHDLHAAEGNCARG